MLIEIKNKFNIGDKVYCIINNYLHKVEITSMEVSTIISNDELVSTIIYSCRDNKFILNFNLEEKDLFKTREQLFKNICKYE